MLEILFYSKNKRYEIKMTGHANYAPAGQDIVCASASILIQAVSYYLEEHNDSGTFQVLENRIDKGDSQIEYIDLQDEIKNIFDMLLTTFTNLEYTYPGFIKVNKNIF